MLLVFKEEPMAEEKNTVGQGDGSQDYQMNRKMGLFFMLISATGMGLVPLFSRWGTRTDTVSYTHLDVYKRQALTSCSTPKTVAIAIRSSTARTAARASPSLDRCPTIALQRP